MTALLTLLLLSPSALANSGGKTGSSVSGCGGCHGASASANTSVAILGPLAVPAGATVDFQFAVANANKTGAGLDVSASSGTLIAGQNTKKSGTEITQTATTAMTVGQTIFDFSWTSPQTPGVYTISAAGNAVDSNGATSGDEWNTTSVAVEVLPCDPAGTPICTLAQGLVTCDVAPYVNDVSSSHSYVFTGGPACPGGLCVHGDDAGGNDYFCRFTETSVTAGVTFTLGSLGDVLMCYDSSGAGLNPAIAFPVEVHGGDGGDYMDGTDCGVKVLLYGEGGDDIMTGSPQNDKIWGAAGADKIYGGSGGDTLYGGAGNDSINGQGGADTVYGGDGADAIRGDVGDDVIAGGAGNDTVCGDDGADAILGEGNDDKLHGGPGVDSLDGGPGSDRCQDAGSPGCELNLAGTFTCPSL